MAGHRQSGNGETGVARGRLLVSFCVLLLFSRLEGAASRQVSVDEWKRLSASASPPRAFFKGERIRVYFQTESGLVGFSTGWSRGRAPTDAYRVHTARLRLDRGMKSIPGAWRGWREAAVLTETEWRLMTTNLVAVLTPSEPGHGVYYQGLLADRLVYRDAQGQPRFGSMGQLPSGVTVDRRYSLEETLDLLAEGFGKQLSRSHPEGSLFLLMASNARRFPQPLLLDLQHRQCIWLAPASSHDPTERGFSLVPTLRSITALICEGHGVALVRNPISSLARLGDLGVQTTVRFLRFPLPKPSVIPPTAALGSGLDLEAWEQWLDRHTGTKREEGSMELLIDGERFFPRLEQAIEEAKQHVHLNVFIFDQDDVAVEFADLLKRRSQDVRVRVILDQMGSLGAGSAPPTTPLPDDFVAPSSITRYLRQNSRVQVHPFLNPWFTAEHSKTFLVDGTRAWLGGMNIGREYRYEWHDLMVEVAGPIVASLEEDFRRQWAHGSFLGDLAYAAAAVRTATPKKPIAIPGDWIALRRLPTRTAWKPFSTAVQGALRRAGNHVYVEHPYLFDTRVIGELVRARVRGADVRVILPRWNDQEAGGRSNLVLANYLLSHGVRVYFHPGMTHVKALLVDGWSCVGSGNLNHLSLRVAQEQNLATSDPAFAARLRRDLFEADFARSYEQKQRIEVGWTDILADLILEGF